MTCLVKPVGDVSFEQNKYLKNKKKILFKKMQVKYNACTNKSEC